MVTQTRPRIAEILEREFLFRKSKNPQFSLRAFAKYLGVGKTVLSDTLALRRHPSRRNCIKIGERLGLSPREIRTLISKSNFDRSEPLNDSDFLNLDTDTFHVISDWFYFAILNLAKLKGNRSDPFWVGRRLGISPIQARLAVNTLKRLGLIDVRGTRLVRTSKPILTKTDVPSSALRAHQKQNLTLAEASIDRDPVDMREFSSVTMPVNTLRLKEVKRRILEFKEDIASELEAGECTEVYTLAVQLFPLTKLKGTNL